MFRSAGQAVEDVEKDKASESLQGDVLGLGAFHNIDWH